MRDRIGGFLVIGANLMSGILNMYVISFSTIPYVTVLAALASFSIAGYVFLSWKWDDDEEGRRRLSEK